MKQNPTIYKTDNNFSFKEILLGVTKALELNDYKFQLKSITISFFSATLIVIESEEKESEWATFFPSDFTDGINLQYKMPHVLVLIQANSGNYAIIGGGFYKFILPFLDMSYGLNTYSRLMNPSEDSIITIKTRGITGLRAGMLEQFKDDYHIMDYIKFGKIPTEMKIKLADVTANVIFGKFLTKNSPSIIINISSGFNLNKPLTFEQLGLLLEILEDIESVQPNDFFSSYKEITNKDLIANSLKPAIINDLFQKKDTIIQNRVSNYDVCYPNKIEEFYSSDRYLVKLKLDDKKYKKIAETNDKSDILPIILKFLDKEGFTNNLSTFSNKIYNIYISSFRNGSNTKPLRTALIYHLNSELYISGLGTYIYLDSKYYKLREIFINEMNQKCQEILTNHNLKNEILDEKWELKAPKKREDEGSYNYKYDKPDYFVLDTISPESVELADIICLKNGRIYLCHVKYGFSTDLRELYSQIISSSRRLKSDLKSDNSEYLKKVFKSLKQKNLHRNLTEDSFIKLFRDNKIEYILAVTGHLKGKSLLKSIKSYKSNIAKLSIIQCHTEMRTEYYDLSIEIIDNKKCFE